MAGKRAKGEGGSVWPPPAAHTQISSAPSFPASPTHALIHPPQHTPTQASGQSHFSQSAFAVGSPPTVSSVPSHWRALEERARPSTPQAMFSQPKKMATELAFRYAMMCHMSHVTCHMIVDVTCHTYDKNEDCDSATPMIVTRTCSHAADDDADDDVMVPADRFIIWPEKGVTAPTAHGTLQVCIVNEL